MSVSVCAFFFFFPPFSNRGVELFPLSEMEPSFLNLPILFFFFFFFQQRYGAASHSQKQSRFFRTEQSSVYCNFFSLFFFFFPNRGMELLPGSEIEQNFFRLTNPAFKKKKKNPTEVWSCFPWSETEQIFLDSPIWCLLHHFYFFIFPTAVWSCFP